MLSWIFELITNPFLLTAVGSWAIAQIAKVIIYAIINKELNVERLVGDGGMPSGHSATVTSLAVATALICGPGSAQFAISAILAIIVCHDAMGVRQVTGQQSKVINEIIRAYKNMEDQNFSETSLKEFVGHTPLQVLVGCLIGILNAVAMYLLYFD